MHMPYLIITLFSPKETFILFQIMVRCCVIFHILYMLGLLGVDVCVCIICEKKFKPNHDILNIIFLMFHKNYNNER
jgi:hypothetical protein